MQGRNMKRIFGTIAILVVVGIIIFGLCKLRPAKEEPTVVLPEIINGQTFVYDELETGEGTSLYTLIFSENTYRLYMDNGVGVLMEGYVTAEPDKSLVFEQDAEIAGFYTGSAFEEPSVTITYEGRDMEFVAASDTTEYAYLSYLGVYESEISGEPAVLILERWFEFYIYTQDTLIRGTYEIYQDGRVELVTLDGDVITGTKTSAENFDIASVEFVLDIDTQHFKAEQAVFSYATDCISYEAAHAMGAYTLSIYDGDVFTIHGVDGLMKAMGTMEVSVDEGTAIYFPRRITDDTETKQGYAVDFSCQEDILLFPDSTYLLPRSGNIDEETGYGSYWSAGTALEFIKKEAVVSDEMYSQMLAAIAGEEKNLELTSNVPEGAGLLNQSMPSVGTARPLVLLIDFPDYHRPRFVTAEAMEQALFDIENKDSLSAFYYVSSYGNLTIDGTVMDWYRAKKNREDYESDKEIMAEAIDYYIKNEGLSLADYDADNDGEVDSLYVLWAGNMGDTEGMWTSAYRSTWGTSPVEWERSVKGYIFVPGVTVWSSVPPLSCNLNSLTHETGHLLGLNDFYSYDTTDREDDVVAYTGGALEGGIGGMDMMDANIGDHNAFSKWLLGWLEPEVVEYEDIQKLDPAKDVYTLRPSNEAGDGIFVKLRSSDSLYTELLVIEVVSATRNANELTRVKEPVVRILHVDASIDEADLDGNWRSYGFKFDNSYTSTKFISLVEADGNDASLNYLPKSNGSKISYDMADYFLAGDAITPNTYPNTNGYDVYGNVTVYNGLSIQVESITPEGEAVIRLGYETQEDVLSVQTVKPEPCVVPYEKGTMVTIPQDTTEISISFDRGITLTQQSGKIQVLSGNQVLDDYQVQVQGRELKVIFLQELEYNNDYTVVIPANVVCDSANSSLTNRYNSIYGFVTEKE